MTVRPLTPVLSAPAVGKTAVAAAPRNGSLSVISADARQVYRRPTSAPPKRMRLRARVPHFGIDPVEPGERQRGRFAMRRPAG
jgi:tRNA A37 N6-isopentenylltransferase MiaA